jgi:hypothetical protein
MAVGCEVRKGLEKRGTTNEGNGDMADPDNLGVT